MRRFQNRLVAALAGAVLLVGFAGAAWGDTKTPAPAAKKETPAAAPKPVPMGVPSGLFKFGMSAAQLRKALGKGVEPLKARYRLGDYGADFRATPLQITKGVAMRALPLFHTERGTLEMVVLTAENAKGRDFVEVYQLLTRTYGPSLREHSQFQGPYQIFDVNWKAGASSVALYYDEGGRLLTLELARSGALGPEPYGEESWLRASEWAAICGCDLPLYYNRCPAASQIN